MPLLNRNRLKEALTQSLCVDSLVDSLYESGHYVATLAHIVANMRPVTIACIVIGANGIVRGKKVTSLARWPPNPSRCWALTWRTIGPMEDYWARSGGLLAEWPLSTSGGVFPLTRLTTDA